MSALFCLRLVYLAMAIFLLDRHLDIWKYSRELRGKNKGSA